MQRPVLKNVKNVNFSENLTKFNSNMGSRPYTVEELAMITRNPSISHNHSGVRNVLIRKNSQQQKQDFMHDVQTGTFLYTCIDMLSIDQILMNEPSQTQVNYSCFLQFIVLV